MFWLILIDVILLQGRKIRHEEDLTEQMFKW